MTSTTATITEANGVAHAPRQARRSSIRDERIEEIRARRRSRGDLSDDLQYKLSVPEANKDPQWEYRWVNDSDMRIRQLQAQDWEFAPPETTAGDLRDSGVGTRVERVVSDRTVSEPVKGFLMRKPKEFYHEDRAKRANRLAAVEQGIATPAAQVERSYIPSSGMRVDNGARVITT